MGRRWSSSVSQALSASIRIPWQEKQRKRKPTSSHNVVGQLYARGRMMTETTSGSMLEGLKKRNGRGDKFAARLYREYVYTREMTRSAKYSLSGVVVKIEAQIEQTKHILNGQEYNPPVSGYGRKFDELLDRWQHAQKTRNEARRRAKAYLEHYKRED